LVTLLCTTPLLVACSTSGNGSNADAGADVGKNPIDVGTVPAGDMAVSTDGTPKPDAEQAKCGPNIYPCEPYGTTQGDVVENFEFKGFFDKDYLCKKPEEMKRDLTTVRDLSWKDIHQGEAGCTKKELLWVMVSAGWCGPCQQEVAETQEQFEKGYIDPRVILVNVLYEDDKGKPVDEAFTKTWVENGKFQLDFPVVMDPTFTMGKYFDKNAVPFNMLVDLSNMKIVMRQTGANLPAVGQAMKTFFDGK
jgi:thiol-disulfide isomerase/thioredoxin